MPLLADNLGRRKSILIAFFIALIGLSLIGIAPSLTLIGTGLFLAGFGMDTAINICFNFITEAVEDQLRQKHSVVIQFFFSLGGVVIIPYFYVLKNWRVVLWLFFIAPGVLCFYLIWKYI